MELQEPVHLMLVQGPFIILVPQRRLFNFDSGSLNDSSSGVPFI